jgi:hypothetical protein
VTKDAVAFKNQVISRGVHLRPQHLDEATAMKPALLKKFGEKEMLHQFLDGV